MDKQQTKRQLDAQERMNTGSAWMSAASLISRILGVIYIIPWMRWMGAAQTANEANALFNIGYRWYSLFLAVAVAGVPSAIAKQMAYYNARGQYKTSRRLFQSGTILMVITGVISAAILWVLAPVFAKSTPARDINSVILTIRSLVPALALIPFLSILRGFFQGYQDMKPSAISQITEQVARVIYMLAAVYFIRVMSTGSMEAAVAQSTFAAFIGAVIAIMTLFWYLFKDRDIYRVPENHIETVNISTWSLLKEIIIIAIPFIITNSVIEVSQLIDTNTFMPIMEQIGKIDPVEAISQYGIFSANANKLITVIVSLAIAIALTSVPVLSDAYTRESDRLATEASADADSRTDIARAKKALKKAPMPETTNLIMHNLQLFSLVMLPAAMGMAIVAEPLYTIIYPYHPLGAWFLQISCYMAIILGLFSVLAAILQAMNQHKMAIIGLTIGLIAKLALQSPLMAAFGTPGAMYATMVAFGLMCVIYFWHLDRMISFPFQVLLLKLRPMIMVALVMGAVAYMTFKGFQLVLPQPNLLGSLIQVVVVAAIGAWVYILAGLRFRVLDLVIGTKADRLRQLMGIK